MTKKNASSAEPGSCTNYSTDGSVLPSLLGMSYDDDAATLDLPINHSEEESCKGVSDFLTDQLAAQGTLDAYSSQAREGPELLSFIDTPHVNNPLLSSVQEPVVSRTVEFRESGSRYEVETAKARDSFPRKRIAITSPRGKMGPKRLAEGRLDRWRLYTFKYAFVLEPNIPSRGILHRFTQDQLDDPNRLMQTLDQRREAGYASDDAHDLPQLIMFRASEDITETTDLYHQYYSRFGSLESVCIIDALLGCIYIRSFRFLVVVTDAEKVCALNRNSFRLSEHDRSDGDNVRLDSFIYRIRQTCLIPFHVRMEAENTPKELGQSMTLETKEMEFGVMMSSRHAQGFPQDASFNDPLCSSDRHNALHQSSPPSNSISVMGDFSPITASTYHRPTVETMSTSQYTSKDVSSKREVLFYFAGRCTSAMQENYSTFVLNTMGERILVSKRKVEKLLSTSFYYSYDVELTHTLQRKRQLGIPFDPQSWPCSYTGYPPGGQSPSSSPSRVDAEGKSSSKEKTTSRDSWTCSIDPDCLCFFEIADKRFVWNIQLVKPFVHFCIDLRWLVPIIQGSVNCATLISKIHGLDLVLFCRRSWSRAGTRYTHRGIDDSGDVANFNESEQLVSAFRVDPKNGRVFYRGIQLANGGWSSFVQIRGSVPVFWEQSAGLSLNVNISLTRQLDFSTKAFVAHQKQLSKIYGTILYVDLLSSSKGGENKLSVSLQNMIAQYNKDVIQLANANEGKTSQSEAYYDCIPAYLIRWDCHQQIKMFGFERAFSRFVDHLRSHLDSFGYYCENPVHDGRSTVQYQKGCLRTNCLDCLDRTNAFQWFVCWDWISHLLPQRGLDIFLQPGIPCSANDVLSRTTTVSNPVPGAVSATNREYPHVMKSSSSAVTDTRDDSELVHVYYIGSEVGPMYWVYKPLKQTHLVRDDTYQQQDGMLMGDVIKETECQSDVCRNIVKEIVARMWADQGDRISRAYTGTDSVMSSVIRQGKSSLTTNMVHMVTSLERFYQNNFEDNARQDAIDILLQEYVLPTVTCTLTPRQSTITCHDSPMLNTGLPDNHSRIPVHLAMMGDAAIIPCAPTVRSTGSKNRLHDEKRRTTSNLSVHRVCITQSVPIRIWFGTWNMGGRFVPSPVDNWIFCHMNDYKTDKFNTADIYVVAVQELVELTKVRVLLSQGDREKEEFLEHILKKNLGPHFVMLKSHSLVGLFLTVFIRSSFKHYVTEVHTSELKLGFKGQMGNKGAVFLRFKLANMSFCFANVHLSSGLEKARQRREQLRLILESTFQSRLPYRVQNHDCVLLGGDFNFRCGGNYNDTMNLLKRKNYKELLLADQLIIGKRLGLPPFDSVQESAINFPPTYKFKKDSNKFDDGRSPGWCDRVLYAGNMVTKQNSSRSGSDPLIRCLWYTSVHDIMTSDHKPVYAVFETAVTLSVVREERGPFPQATQSTVPSAIHTVDGGSSEQTSPVSPQRRTGSFSNSSHNSYTILSHTSSTVHQGFRDFSLPRDSPRDNAHFARKGSSSAMPVNVAPFTTVDASPSHNERRGSRRSSMDYVSSTTTAYVPNEDNHLPTHCDKCPTCNTRFADDSKTVKRTDTLQVPCASLSPMHNANRLSVPTITLYTPSLPNVESDGHHTTRPGEVLGTTSHGCNASHFNLHSCNACPSPNPISKTANRLTTRLSQNCDLLNQASPPSLLPDASFTTGPRTAAANSGHSYNGPQPFVTPDARGPLRVDNCSPPSLLDTYNSLF